MTYTSSIMSLVAVFSILLFCSTYASDVENKRLVLHSEVDIAQELLKIRADLTATTHQLTELENKIQQLEQENVILKQGGSGSVYTRWGRNTCPGAAELIYKGYMAGRHYIDPGSGNNDVCLPSDPTWATYHDGSPSCCRAYIYGTEVDPYASHPEQPIFEPDVKQQDMPCAVCRAAKSTTVMIPARNDCYSNWTLEYRGYLMAGLTRSRSSDHICLDSKPEFLPHGGTNDNQHIIYPVEGRCGSLACPPYVDGRELACVVCSK